MTLTHRAPIRKTQHTLSKRAEWRLELAETGGAATQAGIFYQNSVAAIYLAEMLDLSAKPVWERISEIRVEAPTDVDDILVEFRDGHREFISVKLNVHLGNTAWTKLVGSLSAQYKSKNFNADDRLVIIVSERSRSSISLSQLLERAYSALDIDELLLRCSAHQRNILSSLVNISAIPQESVLPFLTRISIRHLPQETIDQEPSRRGLAGDVEMPQSLFSVLRDVVGREGRRRGLFRSAPLRKRLREQFGLLLQAPRSWSLPTYRNTIKQLCRVEVPGTGYAGTSEELFVWPRASDFFPTRPSAFEDEDGNDRQKPPETSVIDFKSFPEQGPDRLVVVGGPGFGKSALLTAIAGRLSDGPFIPVFVRLADLAAADTTVMSFLSDIVSREMDLKLDWQELAEQGLLVILFDGLDEVPGSLRPSLLQRISILSARYSELPWILTVRNPSVVSGLPQAKIVELLPLNESDIKQFVDTMSKHFGGIEGDRLIPILRLHPDLGHLARIPLFLSILVTALDISRALPKTRADLIETYLKTLFSPSQQEKSSISIEQPHTLRKIAEKLAFERLELQEIGASEREILQTVAHFASGDNDAHQLFEQLKLKGILRQQGPVRLQFPFPIIQEYLAACFLVEKLPATLEGRIDDAIQRPWAQVIQFSLELHPSPETILQDMLRRIDDAFCTGLRLVARCIANGATVSPAFRRSVGDRLVEFWIKAPSHHKTHVGNLLAQAFADPLTDSMRSALQCPWLISHGASVITSMRKELELTMLVVESLMDDVDEETFHHLPDLKPAFNAAGESLFRLIKERLYQEDADETLIGISTLLTNFSPGTVPTELVISVARDVNLPYPVRIRAYEVLGPPLDEKAIDLVEASLRQPALNGHHEAQGLIKLHADPEDFLHRLLLDVEIPLSQRIELSRTIYFIFSDEAPRLEFVRRCIYDTRLHEDIRISLQVYLARHGDRQIYETLVSSLDHLELDYVRAVIGLFGHFQDAELAARALDLIRQRDYRNHEIVEMAKAVSNGMVNIFDMEWGFGGYLRPASPHPGVFLWTELLEDWTIREDLSPVQRAEVLTEAAKLGSMLAYSELQHLLLKIDDFDGGEWEDEHSGLVLAGVLRQLKRTLPSAPWLVERIVSSARGYIVEVGIDALLVIGGEASLKKLVELHVQHTDWMLKNDIEKGIEVMAARQNRTVLKNGDSYELA